MPIVYILKSLITNEYYIGCTEDFPRRLKEHEKGNVQSTKPLRPLQVMLIQEYQSLSKARKIEKRLKKLKRKDYIDKIVKDGYIKMDD